MKILVIIFLHSEQNDFRERLKNLKENIFFELFVIFVIVFSGILIGVKTYNGVPPQLIETINSLDYAITLFFFLKSW